MLLVQKGRHLEKIKLGLYLLLCVMINSKCIRYFDVRNKTINLLKESGKVLIHGMERLLKTDPKSISHKKIDKSEYI